jgi:hypothetical protein
MEMMPILPETELEAMAAQHLGRLLFVFGRLELNLGLALVRARPADQFGREIARVEKLPLAAKLREIEALVLRCSADDAPELARWKKWFTAAHALCELKDDFAHGRWDFQNMQQQIVHAGNLPGSAHPDEVRYTLDEFSAHVARAEEVAEEFSTLRDMHPVDACHEIVMENP